MRLFARIGALVWLASGCGSVPAPPADPPPPTALESPLLASAPATAEPSVVIEPSAPAAQIPKEPVVPCPPEMVHVAERFCIDRYEASMVDKATRRPFSPFYPPNRKELRRAIAGQKWGPAALGK